MLVSILKIVKKLVFLTTKLKRVFGQKYSLSLIQIGNMRRQKLRAKYNKILSVIEANVQSLRLKPEWKWPVLYYVSRSVLSATSVLSLSPTL